MGIKFLYKTEDGKVFDDMAEAIAHDNAISKKYEVTLYFTGEYTTTVSASSEKSAVKIAHNEWTPDDISLGIVDTEVKPI